MATSSLATSIAGTPLQSCIYNASGPRSGTVEALTNVGNSASGAVLSKSATLLPQMGNPTPRYVNKIPLGDEYAQGSLNSEGLPNQGIHYYISDELLHAIPEQFPNKPYIVSISGLSLEDNLAMLDSIFTKVKTSGSLISAVEVNLACPNVPNKPMVAYDFDQMDGTLARICALPDFALIPIGVKLAPYFDIPHFHKVASILSKYPIKFIVCTNTIGNALIVNAEAECAAIVPREGLGGLGGGFIKHTALANVRMFYTLLHDLGRDDIDIVGVGGIASGADVFEYILCGARAVQVATCHWTEGPSCFDRIGKELKEIMVRKGYKTIDDFRGKLKPYCISSTAKHRKKASPAESNVQSQVQTLYLVIALLTAIIAVLTALLYQRNKS